MLIDEAIKVTKKLCVQIQCPSNSSTVSHQPVHSEKKNQCYPCAFSHHRAEVAKCYCIAGGDGEENNKNNWIEKYLCFSRYKKLEIEVSIVR